MKTKLTSLTTAAACLALLCATSVSLRAATITVTSTADSGPGTLRDALAGAANGDIIDATGVTGTITLTSGELPVLNSVAILGPGPGVLTVSGNNASRVFNVTGTHVTISGLTIANGYGAVNGAGINAGGSPGSVLTVSGCVITNNHTTLDGGGIFNSSGVTMTLSNCTISGNSAPSGSVGGIYNSNATLTVIASTVNGNSAWLVGGGIMNYGESGSAALTISASTFSSNSAWSGGGICNDGQSGSATLNINASTFSGNSAASGFGGTLFNNGYLGSGTLEIGDTILNAGSSGGNIYNYYGAVTSDGYNLSSDDGGGFLTGTNDQINTDPKLGPLQDNGGPTWTCALLPGSPAIDQGKRDAIPALARNTDQRGLTRPVDFLTVPNALGGDGSDIGAFEMQYSPVVSTADNGPGTLRNALADVANGGTIAFGITGTITLTNGQLNVSNSVTLLGPGPGALTVSGNNASGVFNITGTNVTISGLTIANGYSTANGAGINAGGGSGSVLNVSGCVITNNSTTQSGGGIYNNAGLMLTITNCTLAGNSAQSGNGGGVYNQNGMLTVVASTLNGNLAGFGGGIANDGGSGGNATMTLNASTISSNSAYGGGGGILNWGQSGSATLTVNASTFSSNSAGGSGGGGIFNNNFAGTGKVEIADTIFSAGSAGANIYNYSGPVKSDGYNLSSDSGGGYLTNATDQINTDPKLGPLQNNGGPTWTHALLSGSPAIDQGKRDAIPALACNTDQRGFPRPCDNPHLANAPGGDGSDIGAFEVQYLIATSTADSGPGTLRTALATAGNVDIIDASGVSGTITLTNGELAVSNSVTILGPGPGALTVSGNHASRVFHITGANVTLSGLTIANGQVGDYGGGIYNNPGVTMTVSNCTISGNSAGWWGGGIYSSTATLTVIASTLSNNSADWGGGICNYGPSSYATLTVNSSTFNANSAHTGGGGIVNVGSPGSATLTINASTFSANSATNQGGAINNQDGTVIISTCTFSANSAPLGGILSWKLYGTASLELGDTILNADASSANIFNIDGTVTSDGYNLSSDGGGGFLTATGDQVNTDPKLGPLQNNGGPTFTHALLPGSPALDRGKRDAVPALALNTDQRGFPRPVDNPSLANAPGGDGSDIGAFEEQYSALALQIQNVAGQPNQKNLIFTPWASGWTYTLQFTTNLAGTAFAPLTGYGGPTTNGTEVIVTDLNAAGPQKFYRIQISLP
jgi:hypothetical protein